MWCTVAGDRTPAPERHGYAVHLPLGQLVRGAAEQHFDGLATKVVVRDADRRKLRPEPGRHRFIVERHYRDVLSDPAAGVLERLVGAHREAVIEADEALTFWRRRRSRVVAS